MTTNNQLKSHDYPEVYKDLGINLSELGCVMLDLEPIPMPENLAEKLYISPDTKKFWINGWSLDKVPHITLLYGLLKPAGEYSAHIESVIKGWKMKSVKIESVGYFHSPYQDEQYYCIVAHIEKTPELIEGHQRLEFLPHVNTFAGYKPHMTIAYIKKDDAFRDEFIKQMTDILVGKELPIKKSFNLGGNK